ncbi:MAG: hypothetical protein MJZ38_05375 [archaeon]|nr:hypothetical protein [archaeon]
MDLKSTNPLGIIGIIGAIILVVGVFLTWGSMTVGGTTFDYTGMDFYNKVSGIDSATNYTYVPLVALICGIISLALMIVPSIMNTEKFQTINNILGLVALILSVVVVVCGILFYTQTIVHHTMLGDVSYKFTDIYSIGMGFWLVLVGGIITLVGGIMPILKNKVLA